MKEDADCISTFCLGWIFASQKGLCTCGIQLVTARINAFNSRIPYAHVHMAYEQHFMVATWLCVDTFLQWASTGFWTPAVESVCKVLCFCGGQSYPNCTNMKLGKSAWRIVSFQNFSQSLRFLIYFQKLSMETALYVEFTLLPGQTGISAI